MTNLLHDNIYKKYLFVLLTSTFSLWCAVLIFCALVDPYGFIRVTHDFGLSESKPVLHHQERLTKAYATYSIKPDAIILGTSRQGHAINFQQAGFMDGVNSAYNLSFDGAHINEIYAYLKHAQTIQPLKRVLIGLDFGSFGPFIPQQAFRPGVLKGNPNSVRSEPLFALLGIYLTFDAFKDSIYSFSRRKESPYWDLSQGIRTDRVFNERLTGCGGVRENFRIRESRDIRQGLTATDKEIHMKEALDTYRSIIRFAHFNKIELTLFISPTHARSIVLLELMGGINLFNEWKRELVEINSQEAKRSEKLSEFRIFDFSGYNSITTEHLPKNSDHETTMKGYWELSHYKPFIGKLIMNRIYHHSLENVNVPEDFGIQITTENLDQHLSEQIILSANYREKNSEELADLVALFKADGKYYSKPGCGVL